MTEIIKFDREFVERTKIILLNYKGEYSFSNVLNCTLGLLILPYENILSNELWRQNIDTIKLLPKFELVEFNPVKKIKKDKIIYYNKSLEILLKKIRNGLAHQNIIPINMEGKLKSIKIINKFLGITDLEIVFTETELRDFCIFISDLYLEGYNS